MEHIHFHFQLTQRHDVPCLLYPPGATEQEQLFGIGFQNLFLPFEPTHAVAVPFDGQYAFVVPHSHAHGSLAVSAQVTLFDLVLLRCQAEEDVALNQILTFNLYVVHYRLRCAAWLTK